MALRPRLFCALAFLTCAAAAQPLRPPAVPLVTHDPYFSIWSMNDRLTDGPTRHWTGTTQPLVGLARIDGQTVRWMGTRPGAAPAMQQTRLQVTPTRTTYGFEQGGVRLDVSFLSPLIPSDLALMSRPVTYLNITATSTDGTPHAVEILFAASSMLATNTGAQEVVWSRSRLQAMSVLRASSFEQPVLAKSGDNLRIDWGSLLVGAPDQAGTSTATVSLDVAESLFSSGRDLGADDIDMPQPANRAAALAVRLDLGRISAAPVSRHILLAYDDLYSIEYLKRWMRPYWRKDGMGAGQLLETAERDYAEVDRRARAFDEALTADLRRTGGDDYAQLATLAFRQTIAAHKLVADVDGQPMLFPKENFSNGCISTVDVIYPSSPFFLLFNPELLKAQLRPLLEYTRTGRWHFPFAPHDLGTYPKANGQVYGGGERTEEDQMPVEESGNMLLMLAALARIEGNADFAARYWPQLQQWADYLKQQGMDPPNQLSTDDFAGHLAHNANLSIKAILALDAFATLAEKSGHADEARADHALARQMAQKWAELAADGDHYKLAFDKPGTWSQKYNLVWDRVLDLNVFPAAIAKTELSFYATHLKEYGLPLDNRKDYTKLDWEVWTATLASDPGQFQRFITPLLRWVNATPNRVPLTDWYWTNDGKQAGFQARSVVGGVYLPMLANEQTWKKWAGAR